MNPLIVGSIVIDECSEVHSMLIRETLCNQ